MWIDIDQNSDEWFSARLGKLTGSAISKVMANGADKFGDPSKNLATNLAVQQLTGENTGDHFSNKEMERGHLEEPIARALYENEVFCDVTNGGFFDNGFTGCSPDGIVGDGLIEIKSVRSNQQYKTIDRNSFDPTYKWQIFFNLYISDKEWLDYISFCSEFPVGKQLFIQRIYAEDLLDTFIELNKKISKFKELVDTKKSIINNL